MADTFGGGELIARTLAKAGVTDVFGIVDGTYVGLYRGLPANGIELRSPRYESSALHMAGAYARLTGRLGVAMASNGPGVANALPGIAVENGEGNRILLITSTRRTGIGYPDRGGTYQYFDQVGVTRPMTKWSGTVTSPDRLPELLRRALRLSWRGRPGVVHLDVPENVVNAPGPFTAADVEDPASRRYTGRHVPDPTSIEEAAALLATARRPVIHAGSGVLHAGPAASEALGRLAGRLVAPVTTSWGGRAAIVEDHPSSLPMLHVEVVDRARAEADVVLVVGSRLGETDWWGRPPNWGRAGEQRTIQIDLDEELIGLNRPVDVAILADAGVALAALADAVDAEPGEPQAAERRRWLDDLQHARAESKGKLAKRLRKQTDGGVHPGHVPRVAQAVMPDDTVWVFDGGNTAVWSHFFHEVRVAGSLLSTFKFGHLGAGVPQALGAKAAAPDRAVCVLTGDGAFGMQPQEIETAVRLMLPVVVIVLADRQWGMVKMSQQIAVAPLKTVARKMLLDEPLPEGSTVYADLAEIDYATMALSMGAHGERVRTTDELRPALERSLASGKPAVVHVDVDRDEHLWAPGLRNFKKMHEEPEG
jgi:acetolactate synthase I/II/III large subunit